MKISVKPNFISVRVKMTEKVTCIQKFDIFCLLMLHTPTAITLIVSYKRKFSYQERRILCVRLTLSCNIICTVLMHQIQA